MPRWPTTTTRRASTVSGMCVGADTVVGHYDPDRRQAHRRQRLQLRSQSCSRPPNWVPYVYVNRGPSADEGAFELKNAWVVDGLLFGSLVLDTDQFVPQLIAESAEHFAAAAWRPSWSSTPIRRASPRASYRRPSITLDDFTGVTTDGEIDPALIAKSRTCWDLRCATPQLRAAGSPPPTTPPTPAARRCASIIRGRHPHRRRLVQRQSGLTRRHGRRTRPHARRPLPTPEPRPPPGPPCAPRC